MSGIIYPPGITAPVRFALEHPVFDPMKQVLQGHFWRINPKWSAGLTVNIGME